MQVTHRRSSNCHAVRTRQVAIKQRSSCAVASTLDLVGDKWSLLVIRDLLHGKHTYGEILQSPEGIPTNILADRLVRLEHAGIIASEAYQERPVRYAYSLTPKGRDLGDVFSRSCAGAGSTFPVRGR